MCEKKIDLLTQEGRARCIVNASNEYDEVKKEMTDQLEQLYEQEKKTDDQLDLWDELFRKSVESFNLLGTTRFTSLREKYLKSHDHIYEPKQWNALKVGDAVKFGFIAKGEAAVGEASLTDIFWNVLAIENGRALLITDKVYYRTLDCDGMRLDPISWESPKTKSELWKKSIYRQTCQTFYGKQDDDCAKGILFQDGGPMIPWFSLDERECILETEIESLANDGREKCITKDHLFLLSLGEYFKYFEAPSREPEMRKFYGSDDVTTIPIYSVPKAACDYYGIESSEEDKKYCNNYYFLRDIAKNGHNFGVEVLTGDVKALKGETPSRFRKGYIRPAMWVDIEACKKLI